MAHAEALRLLDNKGSQMGKLNTRWVADVKTTDLRV